MILHTGEAAAVSMCKKLQQTDPKLIHEKVSPSQTAQKVVSVLESKVRNGQSVLWIIYGTSMMRLDFPMAGTIYIIDDFEIGG